MIMKGRSVEIIESEQKVGGSRLDILLPSVYMIVLHGQA
jgi:hypothetical protein